MEIHVRNITLSYEVYGKGSPLLLLHGNGEDHHIFDVLGAKLAQHHTLYALDSRNHGESSRTADYSYAAMAEDVHAFIEALQLGQVGMVGFSDGAIIALLLALSHPQNLARMALLGVNLQPSDLTDESIQYVEQAYRESRDPLLKLMLEEPDISRESLQNLHIPSLVIAGEHDIFKPETFPRLVEALPQAELIIMQGHDHSSYIVSQDILYPVLKDFFQASVR